MTLTEIRETVQHISGDWRSGTANKQKSDLADLDDLLGRLDHMATDTAAETEILDELRGRIEILMDEIDISLGIEPAPIPGLADLEADPRSKTRSFRKASKSTTDLAAPRQIVTTSPPGSGHAATVSCPGVESTATLGRIVSALPAWGWVGPAGCWLNRPGLGRPPNLGDR